MSSVAKSSIVMSVAQESLFGAKAAEIRVGPGATVLVGPNATGKTRTLRQLQFGFQQIVAGLGKKVRFLGSGRNTPLEKFRGAFNQPHSADQQRAHLSNALSYRENWAQFDGITGDLLALEQRADLLLKVQARLQAFLGRSLSLTWSPQGLQIAIVPTDGRAAYAANGEASGILQLVPLLTSIYHNEIGALLIDEPEISLHPQYQAFIREELAAVAGDPRVDPSKKFVVIATHSPTMLGIRRVGDLTNLVSFTSENELPRQVAPDAPELINRGLAALVPRLTATHRLAFFARDVLLVEGPSDELVLEMLALAIQHPLMAANTQIVPVNGKGEFIEAVKLFEMLGKRVTILADLDALTDSPTLIGHLGMRDLARAAAERAGHSDIRTFYKTLGTDFTRAISENWAAIEAAVIQEPYWLDCPEEKRGDKTKRRATLAALMGGRINELEALAPKAGFRGLRDRFNALTDMLAAAGAFFLTRGTIEAYYSTPGNGLSKPERAAAEAAEFAAIESEVLRARYPEAVAAMEHAGQMTVVDENTMLREHLGGLLGTAFQMMSESTTNESLSARAKGVLGETAAVFKLENVSVQGELKLRVGLASPLLQRSTFPFEISAAENQTTIIAARLPSLSRHRRS